MDLFQDISWDYPTNSVKDSKMVEKKNRFDFLHDINIELDEVRGRLVGAKPLPSIREAFAEVR